jgi:polyisoprenoid-binding protein YceI
MIVARLRRVLLAVSLATASLCPGAWASAWALDPAATRIEFSVRNLSVARVDGTFRLASGHVTLDDEDPSRSTIEAVIDAASVDTSEPKRDAHVRGADFLDAVRYPTITFRSTRIERADDGHWKVTGDLTLRGRTHPVLLDVDSLTTERTRSSAHATTTIDRREFGMTYAGFPRWAHPVRKRGALMQNDQETGGAPRTCFTAGDRTPGRNAELTALQKSAEIKRLCAAALEAPTEPTVANTPSRRLRQGVPAREEARCPT